MATPVSAASSLNTDAADLQLVQAAATTINAASAATSNNTQDTVTLSAVAQQAGAPAATRAPTPAPSYLQVLYLSEEGLTTPQIAAQLNITNQAVETYLGSPAAQTPTTNTTA
jgi:DNA-binding NarL/FixJ family response regulator